MGTYSPPPQSYDKKITPLIPHTHLWNSKLGYFLLYTDIFVKKNCLLRI